MTVMSIIFYHRHHKVEIIKIMDEISINRATGLHSFPSNILHIIKQIMPDPLSDIIKLPFEKGKYIDALKL